MATSNIKRIVGEAVAAYLGANITGLSGKVSAVQEGPEKVADFPSVCLLPSAFTFTPAEYNEVYYADDPDLASPGVDDGIVVLDVGEFEGLLELQLYAKSKPERELYEQRILDFFLSQEGSPGVLFITIPTLTINSYVSLYAPTVKVRLDDMEWMEEFAFDSKRYSFLDITIGFPALTTRAANTIETLQVAINHDLDSDVPLDTVTVEEDGSVS